MIVALALLAALPAIAQDETGPRGPRPRFPGGSGDGGLQIEIFKEVDVRLRGISGDFSLELPHDIAFSPRSFPVTVGSPREGLTFDRLSLRHLFGWNFSFDLTLARVIFEHRSGSARDTDFIVANPSAGGPDGQGHLDWDVYNVHLGLDRPILIAKTGPIGLMVHAGFGFCNISADPRRGFYTVDVPPPTVGEVLGKRQEFLDGYVRGGLAFSIPLWGPVTLTGDAIAERVGTRARGTSTILNFGLFVEF